MCVCIHIYIYICIHTCTFQSRGGPRVDVHWPSKTPRCAKKVPRVNSKNSDDDNSNSNKNNDNIYNSTTNKMMLMIVISGSATGVVGVANYSPWH